MAQTKKYIALDLGGSARCVVGSFDGKKLAQLLRQPGHDAAWLSGRDNELAAKAFKQTALQEAVNDARYAGYVAKQHKLIERSRRAENTPLPADFDYSAIPQLRREAQETLSLIQPASLGQASRISGINPADITVLMIHLQRKSPKN